MVAMIDGALAGVRASPEESRAAGSDISTIVMEIIRAKSGPRGVALQDVIDEAGDLGHTPAAVLAAIEKLVTGDDCYQPQKGYVKPL
jgi:DNA replicative helicase MCM subunit Mcm2 (Cdc46/Mcm family)